MSGSGGYGNYGSVDGGGDYASLDAADGRRDNDPWAYATDKSDADVLSLQQKTMGMQDSTLDEISKSLGVVTEIGGAINEDIDTTTRLLDDIDEDVGGCLRWGTGRGREGRGAGVCVCDLRASMCSVV